MHSPTFPARRLWLWLTTLLIALGSGHFYASDEETMFGVTLRLWHAIQQLFDAHVVVERPILTPYGPMQSVLALLTLPIGSMLAWLGPAEMSTWLIRLPSTWINAVMVASIATLLGWISVHRGHSSRVGIWVALSYAVATPTAYAYLCHLWSGKCSSHAEQSCYCTDPRLDWHDGDWICIT
ncbi:MAG: hypothetical protein LW717_01630 [Chloroflexaceae bacterium]|nr:hypothetical protein [Chloroflexaceae bacterium]